MTLCRCGLIPGGPHAVRMCCDQRTLRGDLSPAIPDPNPSEGQPLPVDPSPHSGPASGITANINRVTTSRGFTYNLAAMLGEGHYEEDPP